jgi:hypothetical protein
LQPDKSIRLSPKVLLFPPFLVVAPRLQKKKKQREAALKTVQELKTEQVGQLDRVVARGFACVFSRAASVLYLGSPFAAPFTVVAASVLLSLLKPARALIC